MHESKAIPQGSVSHGQILAAMGILLALGVVVPLAGVLMIPGVALATAARAVGDAASESGLLRKARAALLWGQDEAVSTGSAPARRLGPATCPPGA